VKKLLEGRTMLTVFLLGLSLYFVVLGYGYGPNSRLFPVTIGVPTAILVGILLVSVWKPRLLRRADVDLGDAVLGTGSLGAEEGVTQAKASAVWRMIGWLLLANLGVGLVGFRFMVPLFVALFARLEGKAAWSVSVIVAALSWAFMVGYFDLLMDARMFRGILFGDLLPLF
jgi:hypothetical protein